jgi:predicted transcriptional regulator
MQGWRNREVAQHLSITEQTVKNHLRAIFDKVGVSGRLELVLYAIHQKMVLPPYNRLRLGLARILPISITRLHSMNAE